MKRGRAKRRTLVIGFGNLLDARDGLGMRLVRALARRKLLPGVELREGGTDGLELLSLAERYDRIVVVDAVRSSRLPLGTLVRANAAALGGTESAALDSLHGLGLASVFALARALEIRLPIEFVGLVTSNGPSKKKGRAPAMGEAVNRLALELGRILRYPPAKSPCRLPRSIKISKRSSPWSAQSI